MSDAASASERFRVLLDDARPPTGGATLSAVEAEVAPVLPLLTELPAEARASGDFGSFQFRECFTVLTLLGRRLALLDLTPTTAIQILELVLASIAPADGPPIPEFAQCARIAVVEGFVRGREERVAQTAETRASRPVRPLRVDDDTFALLVSGVHEAEVLGELVDALGRAMLDADARVAVVDLSQLGEPSPERARAIFAADEMARMLGAACIFSGMGPRWRAAAAEAHVRLEAIHVATTFAEALQAARSHVSHAQGAARPKWRALLERLRR